MAQFVSRGGSDAPATEVLTVADLLSRNAPVPAPRPEPDTGGISVGALLRREGLAPHAAERPLKPRPRQEAVEDEGGADRRTLVRRGAIAAGTLLAAGSVFGAAILTDVTPTANEAAGAGGAEDEGPYPGQGLLDQEDPVVTPPEGVVIDQAAATDPLDPGTAAPTDWVPVAFPGALAGTESGTASGNGSSGDAAADGGGPGNGGPSGSSGDDGSSAAATTSGDDETARSSGGGGDDRGTTSSDTQDERSSRSDGGSERESGGGSDDDGDDDRGLLGTVTDTVDGLTGALLGGGDDDGDDRKRSSSGDEDEGDEGSESFSLFSAGDEDSSAPQDDEDGSESRSSDGDDEGDDDSDSGDDGDDGDDDGDRGLVGTVTDTVGGLLD